MTNKKIYIIITIIILLIGGFIILVLALVNKKGIKPTVNKVYPTSVINILNNPIERVSDNYITLIDQDGYIISYGGDLNRGTFYITVNDQPVVDVSKKAEQAFLEKLQIDQTYACSLEVLINIPSVVDNNLSQYNFGMSNCPGRPHVEDIPQQTDRQIPYTEGDLYQPTNNNFR